VPDLEADRFSVHKHCIPKKLFKNAIKSDTGIIIVISENITIPVFNGALSNNKVSDIEVSDIEVDDVEVGDVEMSDVEVSNVEVGDVKDDVKDDVDGEELLTLFSSIVVLVSVPKLIPKRVLIILITIVKVPYIIIKKIVIININ